MADLDYNDYDDDDDDDDDNDHVLSNDVDESEDLDEPASDPV